MSFQDHATWDTKNESEDRKVIFSHPRVSSAIGDLVLHVNPYNIVWSYGLNTANFSTYGGEVVQILSMYFDDMTIDGEVRSYLDIERIYRWFALYMQVAAQGSGMTNDQFDMRPVIFRYPHRSWEFQIYPKSLPAFKMSRDITVPTYTIGAAVLEPEPELEDAIQNGAARLAALGKEIDTFGKATAAIGFKEDNPFSGPTTQKFEENTKASNKSQGDFFTQLIPSWLNNQFTGIGQVGSKPPPDIQKYIDAAGGSKQKSGRPSKGKK